MKKLIQSLTLFTALLILLSAVACTSPDTVKIGDMEDLKGKTIGVQSGTTGDILAGSEDVAAGKVERFNQYVDVISALKQRKVDCVIMDVDTANAFLKDNKDLVVLDVGFEPEQYAVAVQKDDRELQNAINSVIAEMNADGSLQASFVAHADQQGSQPDYNAGASGGQLVVGTEPGFPPYEYMSGDQVIGVDIDIMARVAKHLDMELVVESMLFDSLIPALMSGKIKAIAAGMTINEERLVNVDFSEPYVDANNIVVIRKTSEK